MRERGLTHELYIGDGVYVGVDAMGRAVIYTSNGIETTNRIVLEHEVWQALMRWRLAAERGELNEGAVGRGD